MKKRCKYKVQRSLLQRWTKWKTTFPSHLFSFLLPVLLWTLLNSFIFWNCTALQLVLSVLFCFLTLSSLPLLLLFLFSFPDSCVPSNLSFPPLLFSLSTLVSHSERSFFFLLCLSCSYKNNSTLLEKSSSEKGEVEDNVRKEKEEGKK